MRENVIKLLGSTSNVALEVGSVEHEKQRPRFAQIGLQHLCLEALVTRIVNDGHALVSHRQLVLVRRQGGDGGWKSVFAQTIENTCLAGTSRPPNKKGITFRGLLLT